MFVLNLILPGVFNTFEDPKMYIWKHHGFVSIESDINQSVIMYDMTGTGVHKSKAIKDQGLSPVEHL